MTPDEIQQALADPFEPGEVKFKPQSVKGNRALAICYIDARCVEDRLDDVFGVAGWQDEYVPLADGNVMCKLSCRFGDGWVTKCDVGGESEQPDGGDRTKAAFSDALKRAAVKFGVGRYLYRLGHQWLDYDPAKKQFTQKPELPAWAVPRPAPPPKAPDPDVYARLEAALAGAGTLAELAAAFGRVNAARKGGAVTAAEADRLAAAKDRRKAELSPPADAPDPAADRDGLEGRLYQVAAALNTTAGALLARHARQVGDFPAARPLPGVPQLTTEQLRHLVGLAEQQADGLFPGGPGGATDTSAIHR